MLWDAGLWIGSIIHRSPISTGFQLIHLILAGDLELPSKHKCLHWKEYFSNRKFQNMTFCCRDSWETKSYSSNIDDWSYHVHLSVPCNLIFDCLHLCANRGVSRSWVTCMASSQMWMLSRSIGMPLVWKLWVRSALVGPTLKLSSWMMVWRWTKCWAWGGTENIYRVYIGFCVLRLLPKQCSISL